MSPDGTKVVIGDVGNWSISVWQVAGRNSGRRLAYIREIEQTHDLGSSALGARVAYAGPRPVRPDCVAFGQDGKTVVVGDNGGGVWLWDYANGKLTQLWQSAPTTVN
jgi:hypothetical protein